jgi:hypothetical protein
MLHTGRTVADVDTDRDLIPSDPDEETVRVYYYGDSGPYGWWMLAGEGTARDGFGESTVRVIPKPLWDSFCVANDALGAAEAAIEDWVSAHG